MAAVYLVMVAMIVGLIDYKVSFAYLLGLS